MFGRDGVTGIPDIDAVCVRVRSGAPPPLRHRWKGRSRGAALPKVRIPMKFDGTGPGSELAGVVQYINENLLDLACFEIEGMIATGEVGGDSDRFTVDKRRNLVQRLSQAPPDIAALQVPRPLNVAPDAQLEHGDGHA